MLSLNSNPRFAIHARPRPGGRLSFDVMCVMRIALLSTLILLLGCNRSLHVDDKTTQSSGGKPGNVDKSDNPTSIVAVPRPNSGRYSTEEATQLLPEFLERSTPILPTDPIVTRWESPTQGIRVHVTANDTVEIIDYLGRKLV